MIAIIFLIAAVIAGLAIADQIALNQLRKEWDSSQGNEEWNG